MLEKRVIYEIPGMREVTKSSVIYASDNKLPLTMDIYYPHNLSATSQLPVVIFVFGFPNSVVLERFGIKLKDSGQYVSWGQLAAASGLIAITYETTQPEKDIYSVLAYVRKTQRHSRSMVTEWAYGHVQATCPLLSRCWSMHLHVGSVLFCTMELCSIGMGRVKWQTWLFDGDSLIHARQHQLTTYLQKFRYSWYEQAKIILRGITPAIRR